MPTDVMESRTGEPGSRPRIDGVNCVRQGWRRVRPRYPELLGVTFCGMLLGSLVPFGILTGPTMCGIHLCYLRLRDGLPVGLDTLFEGFDHFVASLVATLLMMAAFMAVSVPFSALTAALLGWLLFLPLDSAFTQAQLELILFAWIGLLGLVILVLLNMAFFFMFAYLLIVDRGLGGGAAVRESVRAAWNHLRDLIDLAVLVSVAPVLVMLAVAVPVVLAAGFGLGARLTIAALWSLIALLALPPILGAVTEAYRAIYPARPGTVRPPADPKTGER